MWLRIRERPSRHIGDVATLGHGHRRHRRNSKSSFPLPVFLFNLRSLEPGRGTRLTPAHIAQALTYPEARDSRVPSTAIAIPDAASTPKSPTLSDVASAARPHTHGPKNNPA